MSQISLIFVEEMQTPRKHGQMFHPHSTAENDQELINIFKHKRYSFYIHL